SCWPSRAPAMVAQHGVKRSPFFAAGIATLVIDVIYEHQHGDPDARRQLAPIYCCQRDAGSGSDRRPGLPGLEADGRLQAVFALDIDPLTKGLLRPGRIDVPDGRYRFQRPFGQPGKIGKAVALTLDGLFGKPRVAVCLDM